MDSESLFTKCKTCSKEISKSAKVCPQCGTKQKKPTVARLISWIAILFFGYYIGVPLLKYSLLFLVVGVETFWSSVHPEQTTTNQSTPVLSSKEKEPIDALRPPDQVRFIDVISQYSNSFLNAKNAIQKSALRDQRKLAIYNSLTGYTVTSWTGTIDTIDTTNNGKVILSVKITPNIELTTWNYRISIFKIDRTLIEKGSLLYSSLFNLSPGQQIEFSGNFFPSEEDYIKSLYLSYHFSSIGNCTSDLDCTMKDPKFLFEFKSVKPIK
ncbi:MAG: zinc ribbon domain-containing protein [Methylococcaceae bacterium]|nr:zinc ribbon domain-containing protein [Methylococcaceae bacterium]